MLGHARDGGPVYCIGLATAAARWRPRGWPGWRGEDREAPTRWEKGGEELGHDAWGHVRRRAKQEVACGLPRRRAAALSASGAEAERE